ncbi:Rieske (2Fe-2S) protein [Streptosporangium sp. NPDC003464]
MTDTTRRAVMLGAGGAGMAAMLTACAGYGGSAADGASPASPAASEAGAAPVGAEAGAGALAKAADIPQGGGKVFKDQKVVVTQPAAGQFKAFTSVCTHQGCDVESVSGGTINCPCHGSKFKIEDGSVAGGPAKKPLAEKAIKVEGGSITLA